MATFLEDAERLFGTKNLYGILQLPTSKSARQKCTEKDIKKAYFKLAGSVHPDKGKEEEKAQRTEKFQILCRAYAVLSDSEQRKIYDETGVIGEDICSNECDWETVFRTMFKEVSEEAIKTFVKEYRESGEEREDLKKAYEKNEGDMEKILEEVLGVSFEDEERLRSIIKEMIKKGELEDKPLFSHEPEAKKKKRMKAAQKEAKEAEEMLRELERKKGTANLVQLIRGNRKRNAENFDSLCDSLAAKYGKPKGKKTRKSK